MASQVAEAESKADPVPKGPGLPPESSSSAWTRRMVILAFWVVAVCLGLPHWTWTTSIHRSELPLDEMRAWVEGRVSCRSRVDVEQQLNLHQACLPAYPLQIKLQSASMNAATKASVASAVSGFLSERRDGPGFYTYRVISDEDMLGGSNTSETVLTINLEEATAGTFPAATLSPWSASLDVKYAPPITGQVVELIEHAIIDAFADESAALSYLLQNSPYAQYMHFSLPDEKRAILDARTTRAFKYASTYHLTFSLFTPAGAPSAWAIDEAIQEYISPLLAPLSSISKFTIDTQVQLYASFAPSISGPTFDASDGTWRLSHGDLTGFINAAEWPLSPNIASGPTINFVLYVPSPDKSPLLIEGGGGTNWLIPQWGGVQIHNPASSNSNSSSNANAEAHASSSPAGPALTLDDLRDDMLIFADQLAALLGVPATPAALAFRLSSLKRERTTSLMLSASATLGALARLTFKLTSIAIPDAVARAVHETVRRLDGACAELAAGRYQRALEHARAAEAQAERAFFEPSMVGQVYFPDEHKVAVYVPLLGPMAVPLLMAAVKELRALVRRRKTKAG